MMADNNQTKGLSADKQSQEGRQEQALHEELEAQTSQQAQPTVLQDVVGESELNSEQILERAILFALDEAAEQLEQSNGVEPFTVLIKGEELFVEEHANKTEEESYASARRAVFQMEKLCNAYVFCYDGFVDLDSGTSDALIAEFANKGDENGQVIVRLYSKEGEKLTVDETLYHVGDADSLFNESSVAVDGDIPGASDGEPDTLHDTSDAPGDAPAAPGTPSDDTNSKG